MPLTLAYIIVFGTHNGCMKVLLSDSMLHYILGSVLHRAWWCTLQLMTEPPVDTAAMQNMTGNQADPLLQANLQQLQQRTQEQ